MRAVFYLDNHKGSALLIALMILFIFLALGFTITAMTSSEVKISNNHLKSTQAFYLAEAGIAEAVNLLLANPAAKGTIINKMIIDNGEVTVTGSWAGNIVTLDAVGKVGKTQRTVKQNVRVVVGNSLFSNAITTFADSREGEFILKNHVDITGDLTIGIQVGIGNHVKVAGTLYTNQEPSYNNGSVNIQVEEALELPYFPDIPEWQKPANLGQPKTYEYVDNADLFKTGHKYFKTGRVELSEDLELNNVYIECSSLELTGAKYSGVTFAVDGEIQLNNNKGMVFNDVNLLASDAIEIVSKDVFFKKGTISTQKGFSVGKEGVFEDVLIFAKDSMDFSQVITITRGTVLCNKDVAFKSELILNGHLLVKGKLTTKNKTIISGSVGVGEANLHGGTTIIHSQDTGAPIPATIPTGVEITKLKWSEGQKAI